MADSFTVLLGLTSVVGLAFIIERGWMLRWNKVCPRQSPGRSAACDNARRRETLRRVCQQKPSPLGRLLLTARASRLAQSDNVDTLQTRARHENRPLERGPVVLEIIVGIAPLLGIGRNHHRHDDRVWRHRHGGPHDAGKLAQGISVILRRR